MIFCQLIYFYTVSNSFEELGPVPSFFHYKKPINLWSCIINSCSNIRWVLKFQKGLANANKITYIYFLKHYFVVVNFCFQNDLHMFIMIFVIALFPVLELCVKFSHKMSKCVDNFLLLIPFQSAICRNSQRLDCTLIKRGIKFMFDDELQK